MGRKKIYPTSCSCCNPPLELKSSDSAQYHRNKMSNKKRTNEANEDTSISPQKVSTPSIERIVASFMKDVELGGAVDTIYKKYERKPLFLEEFIDHHLKDQSQFMSEEVRIALRKKLLVNLSDALRNTIATKNHFVIFHAECNVDDANYISKLKLGPENRKHFQTIGDLVAEDKKLDKMKEVIANEIAERKAAPTTALMKYLCERIECIDNHNVPVEVEYDSQSADDFLPAFLQSSSSSSSSSSSANVRTTLTRMPNSVEGMAITATPAQAVRVAEVEEGKQVD